jgi:hypothetical protein
MFYMCGLGGLNVIGSSVSNTRGVVEVPVPQFTSVTVVGTLVGDIRETEIPAPSHMETAKRTSLKALITFDVPRQHLRRPRAFIDHSWKTYMARRTPIFPNPDAEVSTF